MATRARGRSAVMAARDGRRRRVEVDVDALGCCLRQALADRRRFVVDGRVESRLAEQSGVPLDTPCAADEAKSPLAGIPWRRWVRWRCLPVDMRAILGIVVSHDLRWTAPVR